MNSPAILIICVAFILICLKSVKVVPKNAKGLVYRFGRLDEKVRNSGVVFVIPFMDTIKIVSTNPESMSIPSHTLITHDNKSLSAEADIDFQIVDPLKTTKVADLSSALQQISQTHIRTEVGKIDSDVLAREQVFLVKRLHDSLNSSVSEWGVQVNKVELKNIRA